MKLEPIGLFKALGDRSRLLIMQTLMEKPMYVEVLAERLKLSPSTVSHHLKKLLRAGLVISIKEQYYTIYELKKEILKTTLVDLIKSEKSPEDIMDEREKKYRDKVLKTFFQYGKLIKIPVQRKKRKIVLEHIASGFETKRKYTEKEISLSLSEYNDDFCTLRRELICENIFTRKNGIYIRVIAPN